MIKRIIALLICFVLTFSYTVMASNDFDEVTEIEEKIEVLSSLDILNIKNVEKISHTSSVSKSNFIKYICCMLGITSAEDERLDVWEQAYNMGIIKSATDNNDGQLRFDEAVTMLVRAAGYGDYANNNGGFPTGYMMLGEKLEITKNLSKKADDYVKFYEAVELLINTLDAGIINVISITESGLNYSADLNETVMSAYKNVIKFKGVVEATDNSSLRSNVEPQKGYVIIGGQLVKGSIDDSLIGLSVTAYIREERGTDAPELVGVIKRENDILTIVGDDVIDVNDDIDLITHYGNNYKEKNIKISPTVAVLYNGLPYSDYKSSDFIPEDGEIELIDNNNDNIMDIVKINSYKTVIVKSVSTFSEQLTNIYSYDTDNKTIDFSIKDEDVVKIFENDTQHTIHSIRPYDVLRIAESKGSYKKLIEAKLSRQTVSATVSAISNKNDKTIITADTRELILSPEYEKALENRDDEATQIKIGKKYTFYLDDLERVAYAKLSTDDMLYAMLKSAGSADGLRAEHKIKIFTHKGEWKVLELKEKVLYNGVKIEAADAINNLAAKLGGGEGLLQITVIGYALDDEGNVKMIESVVEGNASEERINAEENFRGVYQIENGSFGAYFINPNAVIWKLYTDKMDDKKYYSVSNTGYFQDGYTYPMSVYDIDEYGFVNVIVIGINSSWTDGDANEKSFFVVDTVGEALMPDGDIKYQITGTMGSYSGVSCYTHEEEKANVLKKGDIVSIVNDSTSDTIFSLVKYHSPIDDGFEYKSETTLDKSLAVLKGKVKKYDADRKFIVIDCGDRDWVIRTTANPGVVTYDTESEIAEKGSLSDLVEGTYIVVKLVWQRTVGIAIIR